jgi:hypothetical protein
LFGGVCVKSGGWEDFAFYLSFLYFLFDITSLPQDIYYLWATTSPDMNLKDPVTQQIGYGLAIANMLLVEGLMAGLFSYNLSMRYNDPSESFIDVLNSLVAQTWVQYLYLLPQTITMVGSFSYAIYIFLG